MLLSTSEEAHLLDVLQCDLSGEVYSFQVRRNEWVDALCVLTQEFDSMMQGSACVCVTAAMCAANRNHCQAGSWSAEGCRQGQPWLNHARLEQRAGPAGCA